MAKRQWFTRLRCDSWAQVKKALLRCGKLYSFRGQGQSHWRLETSLERAVPVLATGMEDVVLQQFQKRAHHYLDRGPIPDSLVDWLALMQHYGAPTRLLDWTKSPYVAAYFALEAPGDWCSVWAINRYWFALTGKRLFEKACGMTIETISSSWAHDPAVFDLVVKHRVKGVFGVEPRHLHERLATQQGLFLAPGNLQFSFEENLQEHARAAIEGLNLDLKDCVFRIDIPSRVRVEALDDLNQMNINRATLFPGLDGFAQSLRYSLPIWCDFLYLMEGTIKGPAGPQIPLVEYVLKRG